METRSADPFYISEETKSQLTEAYKYWKGKTNSDLATAYMSDEAKLAIEHNIFTPGNYFYNGIGHVTVNYGEILEIGFSGIRKKAEDALAKVNQGDGDFAAIGFAESMYTATRGEKVTSICINNSGYSFSHIWNIIISIS